MQIKYAKSKWEAGQLAIEIFLQMVQAEGFDATEFYIDATSRSLKKLAEMHKNYGLDIIIQMASSGVSPAEHLDSLNMLAQHALECNPLLVNCQAGKDYFTFDDNVNILSRLVTLSDETGIQFVAETHRGRPTYSLPETVKFLEAIPDLYLTTDVSHWMVVHESDLSNQRKNLEYVISRTRHIHARVGYEEGPQVPDPRAPEWQDHLERHLKIWQQVVDDCRNREAELLTITPEFGPPNYMHTLPYSGDPVADAWDINVAMKKILMKRLKL